MNFSLTTIPTLDNHTIDERVGSIYTLLGAPRPNKFSKAQPKTHGKFRMRHAPLSPPRPSSAFAYGVL